MRTDADYDYQVKMLEAVLEKYVNVNWTKKRQRDPGYDI